MGEGWCLDDSRGIPAREPQGEQASGNLLEEGQEGKEGRDGGGGNWKYRMDERGTAGSRLTRFPWFAWPVVLDGKRITMKWTVGCGGHTAGAGADYVASTPAACTLLPRSGTWLTPEPSGGAQQSSVPWRARSPPPHPASPLPSQLKPACFSFSPPELACFFFPPLFLAVALLPTGEWEYPENGDIIKVVLHQIPRVPSLGRLERCCRAPSNCTLECPVLVQRQHSVLSCDCTPDTTLEALRTSHLYL